MKWVETFTIVFQLKQKVLRIYILQNRYSSKFRKFHKKTPVLESLFNKVAGLKVCNFIKENPAQVFPSEISEIFKNTFFTEHLRWLFLLKLL